jgi:hypothetical protein
MSVCSQARQQLQQQLAEASTRLQEYTAADGLIERAVTAAADAGDAAVSSLEQQLAGLMPGGRQPAAAAVEGSAHSTLSAAMQRRIHHNIQVRWSARTPLCCTAPCGTCLALVTTPPLPRQRRNHNTARGALLQA